MAAQLSPEPFFQAFSPNGDFLVGGKLFTYIAGTATPQATYLDSTQTTQNTNPVILDSYGSAAVWLDPTKVYKYVLQDANGNPIRSTDNIGGVLSVAYNILTFGGDPMGATDSTTAMINAHATGHLIYYPAGTYHFTSGLVSIPGGGIVGDGAYQTFLYATDTGSADCLNYTGPFAGRFENFQIAPLTTKSGGYGIVVGSLSGEISSMRVFQIITNSLPNGINFSRASRWTVMACQFYTFSGDGITVNNQNDADSGDSCITNCDFENNSPGFNLSSNGIRQIASGGLKVTANKFNNLGVGYLLDLGANSTSDLMIANNSFENSHFASIQLQRTSGSASFPNIVITGNEFLVSSTSGNSSGIFSVNASGPFLFRLAITGNTIFVADAGNASGICLDKVSGCIIDGNNVSGVGGTAVGIISGANNNNTKYGINQVNGFTVNVNYSTGTNVVASDNQTGTANVTTSTAVGALFYGQITITFPTAFGSNWLPTLGTCSVAITSAVAGGGLSATPISVSQTQLFIQVVSVTNGGVVPIRWSVSGIL